MSGWQTTALIAAVTIVIVVFGLRALLRGRRVPTKAKLVIAGAVVWLVSPIDAVPDLAGPVGLLDDIAVLIAAVRYVMDQLQPADAADAADAAGPVESVDQRLRSRRAVDAADWRLSDDPPADQR